MGLVIQPDPQVKRGGELALFLLVSYPEAMADQTQASTATSASSPASAPSGQKSPLDILEEILKESDAQKTGVAGAGSDSASGQAAAGDEPQPSDEELQAQIQQQQEAQRLADEAALKQQIEELKTINQTPQYQAAQAQDQAEADERQHEADELVGLEIRQLEHTKIPVDTATTSE